MQLLKTVPLGAVTPLLCFLIICSCLFIVSPYWVWLWGFFVFFLIFKKERNETCSQTFNEDISLPLMARKRISQRIIEEKKRKSCNRFLGFMFPNKGAGMSSLIKLVCVIMHSHYSLTEVSHLEKQCRCLRSSLPPFSSHFKPHRHSPRPK